MPASAASAPTGRGKKQSTLSFAKAKKPTAVRANGADDITAAAAPASPKANARSLVGSPRRTSPRRASPRRASPRRASPRRASPRKLAGSVEAKGSDDTVTPAAAQAATGVGADTTAVAAPASADAGDAAGVDKARADDAAASNSSSSSDEDSSSEEDSDSDDDDGPTSGLAPELQQLLKAKMKTMQAQYAAFDVAQREQKVADLMQAVDGLGRAEAELALDMCDKNEIAAAERIMGDEEFLRNVRAILADREREAERAELRRRRAQNRADGGGGSARTPRGSPETLVSTVVDDDGTAVKIVGEVKAVQKRKASARARPEGLSLSAALLKLQKLKQAKAKQSVLTSPPQRGTAASSPCPAPEPAPAAAAAAATAAPKAATAAAAAGARKTGPKAAARTSETTDAAAAPAANALAAQAAHAAQATQAAPAKAARSSGNTPAPSPSKRRRAGAATNSAPSSPALASKGSCASAGAAKEAAPGRRSARARKPRQFLAQEQAQEHAVAAAAAATAAAKAPSPAPKQRAKTKAKPAKGASPAKKARASEKGGTAAADASAGEAAGTAARTAVGAGAGVEPPAPGDIELTADDLRAIGWSEARIKAYSKRHSNPNTYYYRFNAPNEPQATGGWTAENHRRFMDKLARDGVDYQWGLWSMDIPGRVGYQCSNYYRKMIMEGVVEDANYAIEVDEKTGKKKLKFLFKNKGAKAGKAGTKPKPKVTGKQARAAQPRAPPKANASAVSSGSSGEGRARPKKNKKKKKPARRSRGGDTIYAHDIDSEDDSDDGFGARAAPTMRKRKVADEDLLFPGLKDVMTSQQVEVPAMSPHGYVMEYDSWIRALQSKKSRDKCPFTKQRVTRRQLVKLTKDNVEEHRHIFKNVDS